MPVIKKIMELTEDEIKFILVDYLNGVHETEFSPEDIRFTVGTKSVPNTGPIVPHAARPEFIEVTAISAKAEISKSQSCEIHYT